MPLVYQNGVGLPKESIKFVTDRPAHDRRYGVNPEKLAALGWRATIEFEQGLKDTIRWYLENRSWWETRRASAPFRDFESRWYNRTDAR